MCPVFQDVKIAAAPITVSDERKQVLEFTDSFMEFKLTLVMKKGTEDGIDSVKALAARDDLNYGAVKDGITESFFEGKSDTDYSTMWNVMKKAENRMDTISAGVKRIESSEGKYAMVMESSTADWWVAKEPCDLVKVDLGIEAGHKYALAAKKGDTALVTRLSNALKQLKDEGELEKLTRKWWKENSECNNGANMAAGLSSGTMVLLSLATLYICKVSWRS